MIAVRLEDGSTVYAFSRLSVIARTASGAPDPYWQRAAELSLRDTADLREGLMTLPGATLLHAGDVGVVGLATSRS